MKTLIALNKLNKRLDQAIYSFLKLVLRHFSNLLMLVFPSLAVALKLDIWNMTKLSSFGYFRFMYYILKNPLWVSRFLLNNPIRIEYRTTLSKHQSTALGVYFSGRDTHIEIKDGKQMPHNILLHEIGHYVDHVWAYHLAQENRMTEYAYDNYIACNGSRPFSSKTSTTFLSIYKKEKGYFEEAYFKNSPVEFFAESFARYFIEREVFTQNCPLTSAYISLILRELDGKSYNEEI